MVFNIITETGTAPHLIYYGKDKYENDILIDNGWHEDVWFHVDKLSSAHIYLRLNKNESIDNIDPRLVEECAQLTKFNSIEGCKTNNVTIVYTNWANLRKDGSMDVGQVSFHDPKKVKKIPVEKTNKELVKKLENKRTEINDNVAEILREAKEKRMKERQAEITEINKVIKQNTKLKAKIDDELKKMRSYDSMFDKKNMTSNQDGGNDSDEFM